MKTALVLMIAFVSQFALAEVVDLQIKGMTCGSCVKAVKSKICQLPGVESCEVEVGHAKLNIKEGTKVEEKTLNEAIVAAGFTLEKMTPAKK